MTLSAKKKAYLDGLKAAQAVDPDNESAAAEPTDAPAPSPAPSAEAPAPAPTPSPEPSPAPAPAPTAAAPAAAPSPASAELFPGFNNLPEETRRSIQEKWDAASRLKTVEHDLYTTKNRVGPQERDLQALRARATQLEAQLNEARDKQSQGANQKLLDKVKAIRDQYPDAPDADLFEEIIKQLGTQKGGLNDDERKTLKQLQTQAYINGQRELLSEAHPDWRKKRAALVDNEDGSQAVRATVDTPEARELEVWANSLDQHERRVLWPLLRSQKADDTIYFLNRFEHDRAQARAFFEAQNQSGQHAPQTPAASPAPPAAPAVDPDPARRQTAPTTSSSAGQPQSEKKREFLASLELARKQGMLPPAKPTQRRA